MAEIIHSIISVLIPTLAILILVVMLFIFITAFIRTKKGKFLTEEQFESIKKRLLIYVFFTFIGELILLVIYLLIMTE